MSESRQTQEIVRAVGGLTRQQAVKYREALLAAGISCQIANDLAAQPGAPAAEIWLRGADCARAQAILATCRAAGAPPSKGQS